MVALDDRIGTEKRDLHRENVPAAPAWGGKRSRRQQVVGAGSFYAARPMGAWAVVAWGVAAAWVYLLVAHGRFWTTSIRLGAAPPPDRWPTVAILVPARDEAEVLVTTLPSVLAQDYPGVASVVLIDDGSTDGTAAVAAASGVLSGRLPLEVLSGEARPEGWMGKLWALHQGVEHATAGAAPDWFLLSDADIEHPPDSLRRLVSAAVAGGRDQVSLMARLRVVTGWERLIIPAFVYFFASLYPFRRVGRPGRTAAAAGGCVLVRRAALEAAGGIASIRAAVIDDVALARRLKRSGASIWLGLADDVCSVRPYPRLGDLWQMVARSAFTQLRRSLLLLAGTLVGLAAIYLGPMLALVVGVATGAGWLAAAGAVASAVMIVTYAPMIRYYGLGWPWALTLPVAATLYAGMTVDSARRHWQGQGVEWKGRRVDTLPTGPRG
jgi:hopene-associated glycosyltransferase HpnB